MLEKTYILLIPFTKVFCAPYPNIGKILSKTKLLEHAKKSNPKIIMIAGTIIRLHLTTVLKPNLFINPAANDKNNAIKGIGVLLKYIDFKFSEVLRTNKDAANIK